VKYKQVILDIIKKYIPSCKVYLFGSRARKSNAPCADIDLAVDSGEKISVSVINKIIEEIEEKNVPFFIDIVDLHTAGDDIKQEIMKDRVLWSE